MSSSDRRNQVDVVVVGAGSAGIAAAIASARSGALTELVERYGFPGGMGAAALVGPFMSSYDAAGREPVVRGIFEELVTRLHDEGGVIPPAEVPAGSSYVSFLVPAHHNCTPFDSETLKHVATEMLLDAGVSIRFHSLMVGTHVKEDRVESLLIADKAGLTHVKGQMYVDATGDADLVASAMPASVQKGRHGDEKLQPATMFMHIGGVDDSEVCRWASAHREEFLFASLVDAAKKEGDWPTGLQRDFVGLYKQIRSGEWLVNATRICGIDGTNSRDLTAAEIEGRRQARGLMRFLRNRCPGMQSAFLIRTGCQIGVRETRRIRGLYELSEDDIRAGRHFQDAVARFAFFVDVHDPDGKMQEGTVEVRPDGQGWGLIEGGEYFEIPFRCLVPVGLRNVLVGGRCISTSHRANGAVRVMPCCFATGQASGTAAAMCVRDGVDPLDLDSGELRAELRRQGCCV